MKLRKNYDNSINDICRIAIKRINSKISIYLTDNFHLNVTNKGDKLVPFYSIYELLNTCIL